MEYYTRILKKLTESLNPSSLIVIDDSAKHRGHAGARHGHAGQEGETHFQVKIASKSFEGLSSIARHRLVYQILDEELKERVHALSLTTDVPTQ